MIVEYKYQNRKLDERSARILKAKNNVFLQRPVLIFFWHKTRDFQTLLFAAQTSAAKMSNLW